MNNQRLLTASGLPPHWDWCPRARQFVAIVPEPGGPSVGAIIRGRRIRRVWAELSRAQFEGRPLPSMRRLAHLCRLPSSSTAQMCVEALEALGVVEVLAREPSVNALGQRPRLAGALRVVQPYGWEWYGLE